jgi:uncharacterized protein YbjT (DUF2867 family)
MCVARDGEVVVKIAVAGGSGTVGRYVVESASAAGHEAVVLSRSSGIDLRSGVGLAESLKGVEVIVDTSNPDSTNGVRASAFFADVTRTLHAAGSEAGVQRLVSLSIVGIDHFPYGYYEAKVAQEKAVFAGPLSARVVRATQFHEFAAQILARTKRGPFAAMPVMHIQPIAARTVGEELWQAALSSSSKKIVEIAGPQEERLVAMAHSVLRQRGLHCFVIPFRLPGGAGKLMRSGGQLPSSEARLLGPPFAEWLRSPDAQFPAL